MSVDEAMPTSTDRHSRTVRVTGVGSAAVLAGSAASALFLALTAAPGGATGATLTVDSLGDGTASGAHCVDGTAGIAPCATPSPRPSTATPSSSTLRSRASSPSPPARSR